MNRQRCCILGMLALAASPTAGGAQEKPTVGLTITTPTAVGVIWHVSNRVALRPDFSFSTSKVQNENNIAESSASSFTVNVSGLFYVREWNDLRAYVSPRFSYTHATTDLTSSSGVFVSSSVNNSYAGAGSFGAEYAIARRFTVFGETGFNFGHQTSKVRPAVTAINNRKISTTSVRTALGIVFYF